jgi:hypothetical protein
MAPDEDPNDPVVRDRRQHEKLWAEIRLRPRSTMVVPKVVLCPTCGMMHRGGIACP